MKKIGKIMGICLVLVVMFALAACGSPSSNEAPDPDTAKNEKAPNPDTIISEKIANAEEWRKAFDFSDVDSMSIKFGSRYVNKEIDEIIVRETVLLFDGTKRYGKMFQSRDGIIEQEDEMYLSKEDDKFYKYTHVDGKWVKQETTDVDGYIANDVIIDYVGEIPDFSKSSYDEKSGEYVFNIDNVNEKVKAKISDGKLAYLKMLYDDGNYGYIQIYNIVSTAVIIPEVE